MEIGYLLSADIWMGYLHARDERRETHKTTEKEDPDDLENDKSKKT